MRGRSSRETRASGSHAGSGPAAVPADDARLEPIGVPGRSAPAFGGVTSHLRRAPSRPASRAATGWSPSRPARGSRRSATLDVRRTAPEPGGRRRRRPARRRRRLPRRRSRPADHEAAARRRAPALLGRRVARGAPAVRGHLRDAEVLHEPDLRAGRRRRRRRAQAVRRQPVSGSSTSRSTRTTTRRKGYNRWMRQWGLRPSRGPSSSAGTGASRPSSRAPSPPPSWRAARPADLLL